jgi:hypothetical protein
MGMHFKPEVLVVCLARLQPTQIQQVSSKQNSD